MNRNAIKQRFNIIGDHPRLNQAVDIAIQVAPTEVTVLIIGENGTGKDVFSKIIHQLGRRKHKNFIAINCGAIPEGTIDSELFGHEKGSFTSAYESRKGYFEEVDGGTIFLDEIAEMPLATQARLLRVLENGEFIRVGSSKVQKTNVRVVAATNKNLIEAIRLGKFREDLYFRLNTVTIYVPPLRERGQDLDRLFRFFAVEYAERYGRTPVQLTNEALEQLYSYHWPGNVRELRNFVERLTVLTTNQVISAEEIMQHLPVHGSRLPAIRTVILKENEPDKLVSDINPNFNNSPNEELFYKMIFELRNEVTELRRMLFSLIQGSINPAFTSAGEMINTPAISEVILTPRTIISEPNANFHQPPNNPSVVPVSQPLLEESLSIERKEKDLIAKALAKHEHNRKRAAQELGISERTLYRKIKNYDLDK
jgi:transcriptional regulator with PAS, ATPase and Fis domain